MTAILKNIYFDILNDIIDEYNNALPQNHKNEADRCWR